MKNLQIENSNEYSDTNLLNNNAIGYWNRKKEKLKQKYSIITDEDVCYNIGKEKEMVEMLGYKLCKSVDEMCAIIDTL